MQNTQKPLRLAESSKPGTSSRHRPLGLVTMLLFFLAAIALPASANRALPTDLSYSTETTWLLPGLPDLNATSGYIPHNFSHGEAIFEIGNETIHGFRPGKVYPEMYIRDIAWGMETAQYYYPAEYLRDPIEAYLRRQYVNGTVSLDGDFGVVAGNGAIGGILTPQGRSNKQTATTDEETSLIHAAYLYYNIAYNSEWLQSRINGRSIIERLNLAADWLYNYRLDPELQLLWRGHTTDWGDVKFEKGPGYTDYNPVRDHKTASIYDQALAYMALIELAEMNAAVGNTEQADAWQTKAEALKNRTNNLLWQYEWGIYLTHAHITPLQHKFDEARMVSISNALAVYAGLTNEKQANAIFHSLERARIDAGVSKPGLSLYPFYPNQWPDLFFEYPGMGYGNYQNGGVWDWWGGVQIKAEFLTGFSEMGRTHLLQVANDWQKHPGNIIEWQSSTSPNHEGSHYYSAAAGTMGSAIIEGFFGVDLTGQGLVVQPRLGLNDGYIRVYQAATDRYVAYTYDWDQDITRLNYGTNAKGQASFSVLKLRSEHIARILVDGQPIRFESKTVGNDTYTVFNAPGGQHSIEIIKSTAPVMAIAPPLKPNPEAISPLKPQPTAIKTAVAPLNVGVHNSLAPLNIAPPNAEPQYAMAAKSPQKAGPALPDDFSPGEVSESPAVRLARETRLAIIQFTSVALVILTSLALIVLTAIRRVAGLYYYSSSKTSRKKSSVFPTQQ